MQDFSDQKQFKALFDFATEGILVSDTAGNIQIANPSAEKLFGYGMGELSGNKVEILIPQRFNEQHRQLREGFHLNPQARSMGSGRDLFGITKDHREFPVEISLSPYTSDGSGFIIAFIIDISIRKKNEEAIVLQKAELAALTQELEKRVKDRTMILEEALLQLEKSRNELNELLDKEKELNEMKSRFVSMASHEIRTPLTTILSSLSLVEKYIDINNKEKQQQHIKRIKLSIGNLTDLLDDVLSISKLEEGHIIMLPEKLDLRDCIQELNREVLHGVEETEMIQLQYSGLTDVFFDKKIFRAIYINLVTNSLKFSKPQSPIFVQMQVTDQTISLVIKDNGMGIEDQDKEHLFERFFRGQNAMNVPGTGLGLNIVARYVEMLGGTIDFTSKINHGTTFIVTIPNNQE